MKNKHVVWEFPVPEEIIRQYEPLVNGGRFSLFRLFCQIGLFDLYSHEYMWSLLNEAVLDGAIGCRYECIRGSESSVKSDPSEQGIMCGVGDRSGGAEQFPITDPTLLRAIERVCKQNKLRITDPCAIPVHPGDEYRKALDLRIPSRALRGKKRQKMHVLFIDTFYAWVVEYLKTGVVFMLERYGVLFRIGDYLIIAAIIDPWADE